MNSSNVTRKAGESLKRQAKLSVENKLTTSLVSFPAPCFFMKERNLGRKAGADPTRLANDADRINFSAPVRCASFSSALSSCTTSTFRAVSHCGKCKGLATMANMSDGHSGRFSNFSVARWAASCFLCSPGISCARRVLNSSTDDVPNSASDHLYRRRRIVVVS